MISSENIKKIEIDLENAGVEYLPLKQELLDHICSEIEKGIDAGNNFDSVYQIVKYQYIDNNNLAEIQTETKNLLDYKSEFIKKFFFIISGVTIIGFMFKTFRIPGSNWIQFLSIVILSFLFYKIGYYFYQDKRLNFLKKLFSLSFYFVGTCLSASYLIYSFLNFFYPDTVIIATRINMLSYLLLSLILTFYFSKKTEPNILGITTETRNTDLLISSFNLFLAVLSILFQFWNHSIGLEYLLFTIIGYNFLIAIYYLLIKRRFKNRLISMLVVSTIVIHIYHLSHFLNK